MSKKFTFFFILFSIVFSMQISAKHKKHKESAFPCTSLELSKPTPGRIIFVNGSCSSGKSSISKILAQKLNAQYFPFDELVMPRILRKFIVKHYGPVLGFFINQFVTPNFFSKVDFLSDKKKYEFQLKFLKDLRNGLAYEPTIRMYRQVKNVALQGQDVIVESPIFLFGGIDLLSCLLEFDGTNITYVLAYCPWNELVDRLKKRNESPNKKNRRELDWVVGNYMNCFEISPERQGKNCLEYLEGSDVHSVVTEYSQQYYKKKQMRLLTETQHIALQKFPEDIGYYIYPQFKFNVIVNTQKYTPEQGADVILGYLQKKETFAQKKVTQR